MSLWSDDDAQQAGRNIGDVRENISSLNSAQLGMLQREAAIVESGKTLEFVDPSTISQSDLVRMLPSGHLAGLEGQAFIDAAKQALQADAVEQRQYLEGALAKGQDGAQEGLASMAAAEKPPINPPGTRDVTSPETSPSPEGYGYRPSMHMTPPAEPTLSSAPPPLSPDAAALAQQQIEDAPRGNTLSALQFIGQTDENRGVIQDTALALGHMTGARYFDQIPPDIGKMNADIITFQESHGLPANGEINAQLLNTMASDAKAQGNQDALNALSRVEMEGFTPPQAHYDVNPLSPAQIAQLNAEVAAEVGARRNGTYVEDQPSLMQTAAVAPAALNAQEAQAWAAFDKPQPAQHDVPVPETRPTVEARINDMVGAPAAAPLAAELGGPQGEAFATVAAGGTLWGISKQALIDSGVENPSAPQIANYTAALAEKNGIAIGDDGVAKIQEGQKIALLDTPQNSQAASQDNPTRSAAVEAPAAPPPPAPEAPAAAAAAPAAEESQSPKSDLLDRAQKVANFAGVGGMFSAVQELAGMMSDYIKNSPESAKNEQGVAVREEVALGNLAKPVTPMAKGAGQSMEIA